MENQETSIASIASAELQPIIIRIKNETSKNQSVRAFFPNEKKENNYGNEVGVTISCVGEQRIVNGLKVADYDDLLYTIGKSVIVVKLTYIQAIKCSMSAFCPYWIHNETPGKYAGLKIVPTLDPYQNQSIVSIFKRLYALDNISGYSGLLFTAPPDSEFFVLLFPVTILDKGLTGDVFDEQYLKNIQEVKNVYTERPTLISSTRPSVIMKENTTPGNKRKPTKKKTSTSTAAKK